MASIQLNAVAKRFGSAEVLRSLDLEIPDRKLTVLLGPSGCGKSTLLRLVAGLEEVSSGEIRIDGKVVNDLGPKERGCAMVFQNYALYPHKSVFENLAFPLRMERIGAVEIKRRVEEIARQLHISELLDRRPKDLSGGQRQRVAMGRAMIRQPKVFLFDEPLSNLDAELRVRLRLEISRLQRELSATMIFVTHDQVEAMTLADRIVIMRGGIIQQVGAPLEIYRKPANRFVAGFIGSPAMNIFDGVEARDQNGERSFILKDGSALKLGRRLSGRVTHAGIRPEHVVLNGAQTAVTLSFPGESLELMGIENLGDRSYCHLVTPIGPLSVLVPAGYAMNLNCVHTIGYSPEDLHLFDENGTAI
ncbi:ABC transporter ATP-binding protein [Roseixanthobacter pseudopolyaromaticivorans]|uniref:ABC transporter ATP-binding protein n=1 Tax=Xanthobacteraceae TaxID=335928 RepID=UPI0037297B7D